MKTAELWNISSVNLLGIETSISNAVAMSKGKNTINNIFAINVSLWTDCTAEVHG